MKDFQRPVCVSAMLLLLLCLLLGASPVQGRLIFRPFDDPRVVCADGSRAGLYIPDAEAAAQWDPHRHILVFLGEGPVCTSTETCRDLYETEPFQFSNDDWPLTLQGDTILSSHPAINPTLFRYTKWLVPHCSQDYFLGTAHTDDNFKGDDDDDRHPFVNRGADIFQNAWKVWRASIDRVENLEEVVVAGSTVGSIGILNHIELIRASTQGVNTLRFLLDAPSLGEPVLTASGSTMTTTTKTKDQDEDEDDEESKPRAPLLSPPFADYTAFPLCAPFAPFFIPHTPTSSLPCCLSAHCLLRNNPELQNFFLPDSPSPDTREEMLIMDSLYDSSAILAGTSLASLGGGSTSSDGEDFRQRSNDLYAITQAAGARQQRTVETAELGIRAATLTLGINIESLSDRPRLRWIQTNCVTNGYLVPAREFLFLSCQHGNYEDRDFRVQCNRLGRGIRRNVPDISLPYSLWKSVDTWNQCIFQDASIRDVISDFIADRNATAVFVRDLPRAVDERFEDCAGPNCLDMRHDTLEVPSCQSLIEFHGSVKLLSPFFVYAFFLISILIVLMTTLVRSQAHPSIQRAHARIVQLARQARRGKNQVAEATDDESASSSPSSSSASPPTPPPPGPQVQVHAALNDRDLVVRNIRVESRDGSVALLHDIDLHLAAGTLNALCGRSGSGKSTLLRTLSQLKHTSIRIRMNADDEAFLWTRGKTYLRQEDHLGYDDLSPAEYLILSAGIYGSNDQTLYELLAIANELLRSTASANNNTEPEFAGDIDWSPVYEKRIKNLSGGQRRIIMVIASLLLDQSLLLLDEPLTGLDSSSSEEVLIALRKIAKKQKVIILAVVHQPSSTLMSHFDRLLVMQSGSIVLQQEITEESNTDAIVGHLDRTLSKKFSSTLGGTPEGEKGYFDNGKDSLTQKLVVIPEGEKDKNFFDNVKDHVDNVKEHVVTHFEAIKTSLSGESGGSSEEEGGDLKSVGEKCTTGTSSGNSANSTVATEAQTDDSNPTDDDSFKTPSNQDSKQPNPPSPKKETDDTSKPLDDAERAVLSSDDVPLMPAPEANTRGSRSILSAIGNEFIAIRTQFPPLLRRLHLRSGWQAADFPVVIIVLSVAAYTLSFEESVILQSLSVFMGSASVTPILNLYRVLLSTHIWEEHRNELDDRRVSVTAFQLASNAIMFPLPALTLVIALFFVYVILEWDFGIYLVHIAFVIMNMMVVLQAGKTLGVVVGGHGATVVRLSSVYIFSSMLFSSTFVATWKVPGFLRWAYNLSIIFWTTAGPILTFFSDEYWDNSERCNDFLNCFLSDGQYITHLLGFAPTTTTRGAMMVELLAFSVLFALENIALRLRRR